MKTYELNPPSTDEFEPIELGSVLEMTRGIELDGDEYEVGSANSREQA